MPIDLSGESKPTSLFIDVVQMATSRGERELKGNSWLHLLMGTVAEILLLYPGTDLNLRKQSFG